MTDAPVRVASPNQCLIHLHLPRTGGTTLRNLLLPQLLKRVSPDQVFLVDIGREHGCTSGSFAELLALAPHERAKLRFISGHLPPTVLDLVPAPVAFTIMRSPVDRALSDYWYCYYECTNPAHAAALSMSAGEFCAAGFGVASNGQARYLSGIAFDGRSLTEDQLSVEARRLLDRLDYVGVFEDFQQALDDISHLAGVSKLDGSFRINGAGRLILPTADELTMIEMNNRVDLALYRSLTRDGMARHRKMSPVVRALLDRPGLGSA